MVLSDNFYLLLKEVEKEDNWTSLPDTDPRIVAIRKIAIGDERPSQQRDGYEYAVHIYEGHKFIRAFKSVSEAAEELGIKASTLKVYASSGGKRLYQGVYEIRYCKSRRKSEGETQ